VKFVIQPPNNGRREYQNLPEREPDDLLRTRKSAEPQANMLGAKSAEQPAAEETRDVVADFLADGGEEEHMGENVSWKHSRWTGVLLLAAIALLGEVWYLATRSEGDVMLERVQVVGASLLTNDEVVSLANVDRKVPFYKIDLKPMEVRLLRHSLIRSANVSREVNPAKLVISIEERQPVAMLKSESTGETYIIDQDGLLLRPKLISGLRDPARLMQVPLLTGVSEKDTASYQTMAKMVSMMTSLDSGALRTAIGELKRTQTGSFVIYTNETQTPIFIGSPFDQPFHTAIEDQKKPKSEEPLFTRQLRLLAHTWRTKLQSDLRHNSAVYVDARFNGQIIVRHRGAAIPTVAIHDTTARPLLSSVMSHSSPQTR
jgi:cell division septal protein FtsQ